MAKRRVKAGASSTTSGASNHGTTTLTQEEVTVPSPTTVNGEGIEVPPEVENEEVHTREEGTNEEVANVVKENEEVANKEEEIKNEDKLASEEAAIDKEKTEMAAIEGEVEDAEEAGEYSEEEDEEEDDAEGEDDDADAEGEEDEEEEEQTEIGDEEVGEEEKEGNVKAALLLVNTEEKLEAKSEGEAQNLSVTSVEKVVAEVEKATPSKKKLVTGKKGKLKVSGKQKVASTEKGEPKASGKQKVASTEEDKPNALGEKKGAATAENKPEASGKKKRGTTAEDKPEASGKKKGSKRSESMGLIFMCNSKTKKDCFQYKVLGLPASKKDIVQKVYKGMRLFLFDIDKRLMYGIFKAAGPGGYEIQPKAFGSAFPSQVRFTVLEDCPPLGEEKFKPIIKDNYYAKKKFECQLNSEQVRNLCKLFSASGKDSRFKKPKNVARAEIRPNADRERVGRPRVDRERLGSGRIKRKRFDEERSAPRPRVDRERLDRSRVRRPRLEEESWDPRYDRPVVYERERYASPLPPPSRAYDPYYRTAETAMYMRDPVVDHRERVPVLEHHSRLPVVDPYASYREYNPPPRMQASTYPPLASSASEYRLQPLASSASEYRLQPHASSASEYRLQPHASSASEYRLQPHASSASEYRLPEEAPRYEYAPSRPLYRY